MAVPLSLKKMKNYIRANNLNIRGIPGSNVSFEISKGEIVAFTGASGSGKSTLAEYIAGIERPDSISRVFVDGLDPFSQLDERKIHRLCGIVSQDIYDDIVFDSVLKDVVFGPENIGLDRQRISKRAGALFKKLDIVNKQKFEYDQLSLSEKQKIVLASVLIMHHDVLVLDDAFSMLDSSVALKMLKTIISGAKKKGQTVIYTSNKSDELSLADRIIQLKNGTAEDKELKDVESISVEVSPEKYEAIPGAGFGIDLVEIVGRDRETELSRENLVAVVDNISFSYGDNHIIDGVAGGFGKGCLYKVSGPSASGKSTFLKLVAGILKPDTGSISVMGKTVYAAQMPSEQLFDDTVIEDVMYQSRIHGNSKKEARKVAEQILTRFGVGVKLWERAPLSLSMGEQRLVLLAGVFSADADLLILDKPFSGLDTEGYYKVKIFIDEMLRNGKCVIMVE